MTLPRLGAVEAILSVCGSNKRKASPTPLSNGVHPLTNGSTPIANGNGHLPHSNGAISADSIDDRVEYLVDITIAYEQGKALSLLDWILASYSGPRSVHVLYRKFPVEHLPRDSSALQQYFYERFAEKDRLLEHFYEKGAFPEEFGPGKKVELPVAKMVAQHVFYLASTLFYWWWIKRVVRWIF